MITSPKAIATPTCPSACVFASTMIAPAPANTSANVPIASATSARTSAAPVEVDERREARARLRLDREEAPLPALLAHEEARADECAQVMRHGRLRQPERFDEVAEADRLPAHCEQVEDLHARGIAERVEERGRGTRFGVREER